MLCGWFSKRFPITPNRTAAVRHVADLLGVSAEALRTWHRQAEIDQGQRPGVTTDLAAENKRLDWENAELRKANEVHKAASIFWRRNRASHGRDDRVHHQGEVPYHALWQDRWRGDNPREGFKSAFRGRSVSAAT